MKITCTFGAMVALAFATPALAADAAAPAAACPANHMAIIRVSKLKPGGTLAGLQKAIADHAKWYRDHGYTGDTFSWGRVWTFDPVKKMPMVSPDLVTTFHMNDSNVADADKKDAGWAAFVAEYAASSTVVSTSFVCMSN